MTQLRSAQLTGLGALIGTVAVVCGVPAALTASVGWPLPRQLPSIDQVAAAFRYGQVDPAAVLAGAAVVVWIVWLAIIVSIVAELIAVVRGTVARALPGLGMTQRFASRLIATVMLLSSVATRAAASAPPVPPARVAPAYEAPAELSSPGTAQTTDRTHHAAPEWVVRQRDSLWSIAESTLGDGHRWREIAHLNVGQTQPDGERLREGDTLIRPGWRLRLPKDAASASGGPLVAVVGRGDTLWSLAERHLGDGGRWKEIFERNCNRVMADGGVLADPDELRVGWVLQLNVRSDGAGRAKGDRRKIDQPGRSRPSPSGERPGQSGERGGPSDGIRMPPVAESPHPPTVQEREQPDRETRPAEDARGSLSDESAQRATTSAPPVPPVATSNALGNATPPVRDRATATPAGDRAATALNVRTRPTALRQPLAGPVMTAVRPLTIGAMAVLAGGLLALLSQRRRSWLQRRTPGAAPPAVDPEAAELERWLRSMADHDVQLRIDRTLRALADIAEDHAVAPNIEVVVLGDETVVRLSEPIADVPPGIVADANGTTWVLPDHVDMAEPRSAGRYLPAVFSCGQLTSGGLVMLNPMAGGAVGVTGPPQQVRDAMTSWVVELASGGASDGVELIVVGDHHPLVERLPRVAIADDPASATRRVNALLASEPQRRVIVVAQEGDRDDVPHEPVVPDTLSSGNRGGGIDLDPALLTLARAHRVGLVVATSATTDRRIELAHGRVRIAPDGDWLTAPEWLTPEDWHRFGGLLRHPVADLDDLGSPLGPRDLEHLAFFGDDDDAQRPRVGVLGPLQIDDRAPELHGHAASLLAYLAVHRTGADPSQLARELDLTRAGDERGVGRARAAIERFFDTTTDGAVMIDTDDGRIELRDTVTSDVAVWTDVLRGLDAQSPKMQARRMYQALALVRGVPLSGATWAQADGTALRLATEIVDVAHRLSAQALLIADVPRARWAAEQGLLAVPTSELLHRDLMRAADAMGDLAALDACIVDLRARVERDGGWVSEVTERLHAQLRAQHSAVDHQQAS